MVSSPVDFEVCLDLLGPGEVAEDDVAFRLEDLLRLARRVVLPERGQRVRHPERSRKGHVIRNETLNQKYLQLIYFSRFYFIFLAG